MSRIKLIVYKEHTLACVFPESPRMAQVIRPSVLRGSHYPSYSNFLPDPKSVRLASEKDFDDFNVSFKGFDNKQEYEYAEITSK